LDIENLKKHLILGLFKFMTSLFFGYSFLVTESSVCGCEQKVIMIIAGGQREKVKRVEQVSR
jgi:hypothetical protein